MRSTLLVIALLLVASPARADEERNYLPLMASGWRVELPAGQLWLPQVQDNMDLIQRVRPQGPKLRMLLMPGFMPCAELVPDMAPRLSGQLRTGAPYVPANFHTVTIERPADVTLCMDTPKGSYMAIVEYAGDRGSEDFLVIKPFLHNVFLAASATAAAPAPSPPQGSGPSDLATLRSNGLRH